MHDLSYSQSDPSILRMIHTIASLLQCTTALLGYNNIQWVASYGIYRI